MSGGAFPSGGGGAAYTSEVTHVATLDIAELDAQRSQLVVAVDSIPLPPIEPTPAAAVTLPAAPAKGDRLILVSAASTPLVATPAGGYTIDGAGSLEVASGELAVELVADTLSQTWRRVIQRAPLSVSARFNGPVDTDAPNPWLLELEDADLSGGIALAGGLITMPVSGVSGSKWLAILTVTMSQDAGHVWTFVLQNADGTIDSFDLDTAGGAGIVSRTTHKMFDASEGDVYRVTMNGETLLGPVGPVDVRLTLVRQ